MIYSFIIIFGGCRFMRKVDLRMKEQKKYEIIKELVDHNGNKNRAAIKLGCTKRTVNRLIKLYKENGKEGFVHKNRGRKPSTTIPLDVRNKVIQLYQDEFINANFTHFCEILKEDYNISISDTTLKSWLYDEGVLSPKAHRITKKRLKDELKAKKDTSLSNRVKNELTEAIAQIDAKDAHPRRSRSKYMGEMIQMDASSYEWIPGQIWHLHAAIDDATGEVVGLHFDTQETLNGYYNVLYQILTNYGIPAMFYTDRRTVFEYKRKNNALDDDDTFTQFSYACHQLGIDIQTTSVAQAKGRVERLNETLQSRLPVELKRAHINNIEQANEFLKSYLKKFNDQFALHLNSTKSVFEEQPSLDKINQILAIISERKIDHGHSIKFQNQFYITKDAYGQPIYFKAKTTCMVIQAFDGTLYGNVLDQLYILEPIPKTEAISKNFDNPITNKVKKEKKHYIPPMSHPWKHASYLNYLQKMKHRSSNPTYV